MWFKELVGFKEINHAHVQSFLTIEGEYLLSKVNKKRIRYGTLEIPTLADLRANSNLDSYKNVQISIAEEVGDVKEMHQVAQNNGALFQAASQFNLLEMADPNVTPEEGIGIYEYDRTQGPACAIACGAGTIFRNYFVKIGEQIGQSEAVQIDCLEEIGKALGNKNNALWKMSNGYAFATQKGLEQISTHIKGLSTVDYEALKGLLKIGLQWNTEVTIANENQLVTQAYCSALPVQYSGLSAAEWEVFAKLVLQATYEATFYAALKNYEQTGNKKLYLTLVGGGVFGNKLSWILEAIEQAVFQFKNTPLEVKIVSYKYSKDRVKAFCEQIRLN